MAQKERGWLSSLFHQAVVKPLSNAIGWVVDKGLETSPHVYVFSKWAEPSRAYDNTPTDELIAGLDRNKTIHLHELYKIADALSWENGSYFISKKDTVAFMMDFSAKLAFKAADGKIESWLRKDFMENRRDIYFVRAGDLLDHLKENPLPGDNWQVNTLEKKDVLFAGLQHRHLQLRKLIVVSAILAEDQNPVIGANPGNFLHRAAGAPDPAKPAPKPGF